GYFCAQVPILICVHAHRSAVAVMSRSGVLLQHARDPPVSIQRRLSVHVSPQPRGKLASDWREWDVLLTSFHTWKPGLVHDLLLQQLVKMRTDALPEGKGYLMVFAPTVSGPRLGQKVLVDHFGEQNRVSTVSQTNKVEKALRRGRMNVGERHERCGHLGALQIFLIGIGRTFDQSLRLRLAELQH